MCSQKETHMVSNINARTLNRRTRQKQSMWNRNFGLSESGSKYRICFVFCILSTRKQNQKWNTGLKCLASDFFSFWRQCYFSEQIAECQPLDVCFHSSVKGFAPQKRLGMSGLASHSAWMCCAYARSGNVAVELPLLSTEPFSLAPV